MPTKRSNASPRWALWGKHWVAVDEKPFLDRRQIIQTPWFSVLLTSIYAPDGRDPHDHSRWFASLIIRGAYSELVYTDPADLADAHLRVHRRWSLHVMHAEHAHRIIKVTPGLRTLVFAGRHLGTWSFWTEAGKVDWKQYDPVGSEGEQA